MAGVDARKPVVHAAEGGQRQAGNLGPSAETPDRKKGSRPQQGAPVVKQDAIAYGCQARETPSRTLGPCRQGPHVSIVASRSPQAVGLTNSKCRPWGRVGSYILTAVPRKEKRGCVSKQEEKYLRPEQRRTRQPEHQGPMRPQPLGRDREYRGGGNR